MARLIRSANVPGVDLSKSTGDPGDLLALLQGADTVIFVDAGRGGGPPDTVVPATVRIYVVVGCRFGLVPASREVPAGVRAAAELILRDELIGRV